MAQSKLLFLSTCALVLLMLGCGEDVVGPDSQGPIKGIYALKEGTYSGIYYSSYDAIDFRKIADNPKISSLLLMPEHELLLGASQHKIVFIDTRTQRKVDELSVPNTSNPEPNIGYGSVRLFEHKLNKDRCILVNRSVYTIDLLTREIDQIIWDAEQSDKLTYIHDVAFMADGEHVLLSLSIIGLWSIGNGYSRYEMRQRLIKLDMNNHDAQIIYDYPREDAPGSKFIFPTDERILSYDPNRDLVLSFSSRSGTLLDSFQVSESEFLGDEYPQGESVIVQSLDQGSFFKLIPSEHKMKPILSLDPGHVELGGTIYQEFAGGDLYASVANPGGHKHSIVNLTSGSVVLEFESNSTYHFILKEK